ncbi:MAG: ATP-binding cassette domain-containing protein [Bryobacteraceae bacterium]
MARMTEGQTEAILRFDRVTVGGADARALDGISFAVASGATLILFGAAGSGKTVLLKTALGLIRPDAGRVVLFGRDITDLKEEELFDIRGRVGVLFQEGGLFDSLTIEENVSYPLENQKVLQGLPVGERHRRAEEALRFVELEHTLDKFPSELSGGMRRRVGIARAIVTEPALVLYDSPTAGLDPITAYTIISLIVKGRDLRNTATVMATHRFQDGHFLATSRFDRETGRIERVDPDGGNHPEARTEFMVLREGQVVFEGGLQALLASSDPYISQFVRREE